MTIGPSTGCYRVGDKEYFLTGCKYGPMQENDVDFLCPQCGGYGTTVGLEKVCSFCNGTGNIQKTDPRITTEPTPEHCEMLYEENLKRKQEEQGAFEVLTGDALLEFISRPHDAP